MDTRQPAEDKNLRNLSHRHIQKCVSGNDLGSCSYFPGCKSGSRASTTGNINTPLTSQTLRPQTCWMSFHYNTWRAVSKHSKKEKGTGKGLVATDGRREQGADQPRRSESQ